MNIRKLLLLPALLLMPLIPIGCADEESDMGVNLVDPNTLYNGKCDTLMATVAYTVPDDSLLTTSYSFGIIGNYSDAVFGSVSSTLYTQIGLASATGNINFNEVTIDSVVLCLVKDALYPDSTATYSFHFEVRQLAEPVLTDTAYYATNTLPVVEGAAPFFSSNVSVGATDTVVRLRMSEAIYEVLSRTGTTEEFLAATRGLRISILPDGDQGMMSINFAAVQTTLRAYYHYSSDTSYYDFVIGSGSTRFTHFEHDYSGTIFDGQDSVPGANRLYLDPLGGHRVRISFNDAVNAFAKAHPSAVVHHAELIMPVASEASDVHPDRILAIHNQGGTEMYLDDYLSSGVDGTYADGRYRIRISQHLQGLLRQQGDHGMSLVLNSRRSSAAHTILNGTTSADPIRIVFTYSE